MKNILVILLCFFSLGAFAQGLSVNTTGASPDSSAMLDVSATNKGFLFPRVTTVQRDAIPNPAQGLMIFNMDEGCMEFYYNGSWTNLCSQIQQLVCAAVVAVIIGHDDVTCVGGNDGTATVLASGGETPYSYAWSGGTPAGATVTGLSAGTYSVTITDANACTATTSVIINDGTIATPATPGAITGDTGPCSNSSGNVYSIGAVGSATNYTWTVPAGSTITDGQGTVSITVTFGTTSGNISVTASNVCGTSATSTLSVTLAGGSGGSQTFSYTGSVQSFTVPTCVTSVTISAAGAQGGNGSGATGGKGALMVGTVPVTAGDVLNILVGGQGCQVASPSTSGGSGGGGSFVWNSTQSNILLVAAGGGGGGGTGINGGDGSATTTPTPAGGTGGGTDGVNGSGGGGGINTQYYSGAGAGSGWYGDGGTGSPGQFYTGGGGGKTPLTGGNGGGTASTPVSCAGGYGGGGGSSTTAGGGGSGYNGGGGGNATTTTGSQSGTGGGGGSYFMPSATGTSGTSGSRSGNGQVTITF